MMLTRRALLLSGGALACDPDPMSQMVSANSPWLMWGSERTLSLTTTGVAQNSTEQQLVSVHYGRPDTWDFAFVCRALEFNGAWANEPLQVVWNVSFGVGRSTSQIDRFFVFEYLVPATFGAPTRFYTQAPGLPTNAGDTFPHVTAWLPAEQLRITAHLRETGVAAAGLTASVAVAAYVAPRSHIRPEWFKGRMAADEDNP